MQQDWDRIPTICTHLWRCQGGRHSHSREDPQTNFRAEGTAEKRRFNLLLSQAWSYHKDLKSALLFKQKTEKGWSSASSSYSHSLENSLPGAPESSEDTSPSGIEIDLTTLTLTPRSSLLIIDAELKGIPVSPLIDSDAQGCFISCEAAAESHSSGRQKTEAPFRIRGATGSLARS